MEEARGGARELFEVRGRKACHWWSVMAPVRGPRRGWVVGDQAASVVRLSGPAA